MSFENNQKIKEIQLGLQNGENPTKLFYVYKDILNFNYSFTHVDLNNNPQNPKFECRLFVYMNSTTPEKFNGQGRNKKSAKHSVCLEFFKSKRFSYLSIFCIICNNIIFYSIFETSKTNLTEKELYVCKKISYDNDSKIDNINENHDSFCEESSGAGGFDECGLYDQMKKVSLKDELKNVSIDNKQTTPFFNCVKKLAQSCKNEKVLPTFTFNVHELGWEVRGSFRKMNVIEMGSDLLELIDLVSSLIYNKYFNK